MQQDYSKSENLCYLIKVLWGYDRWIILFFLLSVMTSSLTPYILILAPKFILNAVLNDAGWERLVLLFAIILIGGLVLYFMSALFQNQYKTRITIARNGCFGDMLTNKMMRMRYTMLETPEIQELCFRANMLFWDENSGMNGVFDSLMRILSSALTLSGLIIILFRLHPIVPIALAISILVNAYSISRSRKKENELRPKINRIMREKNYLDETMRDPVIGKDIRLFGMIDWLKRWYGWVSVAQMGITVQIQKNYMKFGILAIAFTIMREAVFYGYLIAAVIRNTVMMDDFIMYIASAASFSTALVTIIDSFSRIRQFLQHTNDFRNAMQLEEDHDEYDPSIDLPFDAIEIKDVYFKYPNAEKYALSNVNLRIKKGERIAIVGANGAGKTTLVKLLVGLYKPKNGEVKFSRTDGSKIDMQSRYHMFSLVLQKIFQYAFTLAENISFTSQEYQDKEQLQQAVVLSGLQNDVDRMPNGLHTVLRKEFDPEGITLSGGQMQKLAIARAIYHDAPVIVLDEPTASLDALAELSFYESFDKLFAQKTCVFISHRLSSVLFCDRVVLVDDGRIVDCGSHNELHARSKLYAAMWDAQSKPYKEEDSL